MMSNDYTNTMINPELRQSCCRLCLAPEPECIPILKCFAADKEPILAKILSCVQIKITQNDNLSLRICHHCISYLNSWQSFKNRCIASQQKQQNWLIAKKFSLHQRQQNGDKQQSSKNTDDLSADKNNDLESFQIKEEPVELETNMEEFENLNDNDDSENEELRVDIDPIQFLATAATNEEDEEKLKQLAANKNLTITKSGPGSSQPQLLTSLGLQSVNSYNFLDTILESENQAGSFNDNSFGNPDMKFNPNDSVDTPNTSGMPAECRVCKMKFSTRANARRHERNIHYRQLLHTNTSTPEQKPRPIFHHPHLHQAPRLRKGHGPLTPEMMGIYDYEHPEKYRDMLSEEKLQFIAQYEDFLIQYQTLRCKCCNKEYPKYKNFMAHMRKKFPSLPRNCCFKCFKQFESKAFFVSHVKRRNCINLYRLYECDSTIEKPIVLKNPIQNTTEKIQGKQLLANKVYECKLCPKKFRLKLEFRSHVLDEHSEDQKQDVKPGHCGYCGLQIEDSVERKRHYNNMECIVSLRCGTCEEPFETHQAFLEHVYAEHLPILGREVKEDKGNASINQSSNTQSNESPKKSEDRLPPKISPMFHSRMPQNCQICGIRYNNYNNVLRHMEAKHPNQLPQTYRCSICDSGFSRLSNLRDHMMDVHNTKLAKPKRGLYCRMCMERFDDKENWFIHQMELHSKYMCCICSFESADTDEFRRHMEAHPNIVSGTGDSSRGDYSGRYDYVIKDLLSITNGTNDGNDNEDEKANPAKKRKIEVTTMPNLPTAPTSIRPIPTFKAECKICGAVFNSNQGLSNHMRAHNAQEAARRAALGLPPLPPTTVRTKPSNSMLMAGPPRNTEVRSLEKRFRRMRCQLCQKRFSSKQIYRDHMFSEHQVDNVQFIHCSICKAEFAHEKGLKVHMIKIHGQILRDIGEENLTYKCEICSTVYRTDEDLIVHKKSAHNIKDDLDDLMEPSTSDGPSLSYWYQCKYCSSNFDTNKKLAIHINCHDEFDSNDYSCKDCGNVYSGRKSLWVHRYKKHPPIADPSTCPLCKKVFFDKPMLKQHLLTNHDNQASDYLQELETDEEEKWGGSSDAEDIPEDMDDTTHDVYEVPCAICGSKFSDQDLFTKHMQMHEQQLFNVSDNPLASMFDLTEDEPQSQFTDPDSFLASRVNELGEFVCDICPKTFPQLTALKVHRNWHFRPDGKQIPADPNTLWRSTAKKRKNPLATLKCPYCTSTFINDNNLKRHVAELHRRETSGESLPEVQKEKPLECTKCQLKFKTNFEWVDHKLQEAKESTDTPYQWGCVICGKVVSRKERLIQHLTAHLKDNEPTVIKNENSNSSMPSTNFNAESEAISDRRISSTSGSGNESSSTPAFSHKSENLNEHEIVVEQSLPILESIAMKDENGFEAISQDESSNDSSSSSSNSSSSTSQSGASSDEELNDDEDDDQDEDDESGPHLCDVCQLNFATSKELRIHVAASHFS